MKTFVRNLSLKYKIQSIVWISMFLLLAAALFSLHQTSASYNKMLYQTTAGSLSASSAEIARNLNDINTMMDLFLADATIQNSLSTLKDSDQLQDINTAYSSAYTTLTEYYFTFRQNYMEYMSLYQDTFTIHTHISLRHSVPEEVMDDLLARSREARGATVWVTDYSMEYGIFAVKSLRRTEYLRLDDLGTLIVCLDPDALIGSVGQTDPLYDSANYLLYNANGPIYASASIPEAAASDLGRIFGEPYGRLSAGSQDYFYVRGVIPDFNWSYICIIPYGEIAGAIRLATAFCLAVMAAAAVITAVLSSSLITSITRHFDNLLLKFRRFGDGSQTPPDVGYDYSSRADELGMLHQQFDLMVEEVNQLIRTNYLHEILIKEAQLKALENQMNPHFLYNTLESINWRAKIAGAKDISSMAEALGTLLRITLDQKNTQVPLRRELELVQCYMTIQKYRYEDRLNYQVDVPERLMRCWVLKLTLQPLVENAIRYGLEENTEGCLIQILAETDPEERTLYLYVKNNGSSFEEDLLKKLDSHEIQPHGFGIGLLNIASRMQLTYGEGYGLTLYNEDDVAVAKLTYPLQFTLPASPPEASAAEP